MAPQRSPARDAELPLLYQPWIEAIIGGPIPAEREATCNRCAMAPDPGAAVDESALGTRYFDPRVKCCSYTPMLPNFLVGRILLDADPAMAVGKASVEARIDNGAEVTLAGLGPAAAYDALYERTSTTGFGRSLALLCPYFRSETATCGIWRHRQSVCTTWFCKHERGAVGQAFWSAMRQLLGLVERELAAFCVLQLHPGADAVQHAVSDITTRSDGRTAPADADDRDARTVRRARWGIYAGQERAFFEAAARLVAPMTWEDVSRVCGATVALAADNLRAAHRNLTRTTLPPRLQRQPVSVSFVSCDELRFSTYSAYDPLTIPTRLADVLHVFDGRPTRQALATIRKSGLTIERAAVRRLVDFEILRGVESETP